MSGTHASLLTESIRDMNSQGGRLVVICGIDGSGKTVQAGALADRARQAGQKVKTIEFPRYEEGFFSRVIMRYLRGDYTKDASHVDPYMAALPFACDRWEAAEQLRKWLEDGALVICNRYVPSNLAHQGGKLESKSDREEFFEWVLRLEYEIFGVPRPDLHVWLDMPPRIACRLMASEEDRRQISSDEDIHERSIRHLESTRAAYAELAARAENWRVVSCAQGDDPRPVQEITDEAWSALREVLAWD